MIEQVKLVFIMLKLSLMVNNILCVKTRPNLWCIYIYSKLFNNSPAKRFHKHENDCKLPDDIIGLYTEDDSSYIPQW